MRFLNRSLTILFLAFFYFANAQTLKFEQYTTKDGLLSDEVYNLHQDRKGYIWLFTNYGAMKYNGKTFEPVLKNLPFKESFIYSFFENEKGEKWAANSNANIYKIINDSAFIVKGTESASEKLRSRMAEICELYIDDSLNIYACSKMYSFKFLKNKDYNPLSLNTDAFKDSVLHLILEPKKNVLLSVFNDSEKNLRAFFSVDSLYKIKFINDKNHSTYKISLGKNFLCKPGRFKRFNNTIYFSSCSDMYAISGNKMRKIIELNSRILFFTKSDDNHLWVGCYHSGLYEYNEKDSLIHHYFPCEHRSIHLSRTPRTCPTTMRCSWD